MHRVFPLALVTILAAASVLSAHAAPGVARVMQAPGVGWRLSAVYYPAHTKIIAASGASNAELQGFAGAFHASSYAALGRIDRRGRLQVGTFTTSTGHGTALVNHVLSWSYAVSMYPTAASALRAVQDIRQSMQPLSGIGPYGRSTQYLNGAGERLTVSTLGEGTTVIELLCGLRNTDVSRFGRLLGRYCVKQRLALYRLATRHSTGSALTPGVTPTPTTTPTGTDALSSPILSFYTQGSHDTCLLSGKTTSVLNTTPEMFVQVLFAQWQGNHQIVYEWYAPDGSLFFNTSYSGTDLGSAVLCAWMTINHTAAATLPGIWTVRLRIDGQESASASFSLTDASTPEPLTQVR